MTYAPSRESNEAYMELKKKFFVKIVQLFFLFLVKMIK